MDNAVNVVIVVPHSHWDREWYLPFEAFRMRLVELIDALVDALEADPREKFHLDGQTIVLEDYEQIRGKSERLDRLLRKGRIAIGPWYVQPDEFLPSGEAIIRNLQTGVAMADARGRCSLVGYLPDMFGHIGQMPQIFRGVGVPCAMLWRGVPASVDKCGFIWRSPDGSEVLGALMPMGYSNGVGLDLEPAALKTRIIITRGVLDRFIEGPTMLLMAGTDHQQPNVGLARALDKAFADMPDWEVRVDSLMEYCRRLEAESVKMPSVTGELRNPHYAPILPATASTRLYLKRRDFQVSSLLERYAEPLAAWVEAMGGTDRRDFLRHAWKLLLENHPHDSICGCSVDEVHRQMMSRYERVETVVRRILDESTVELCETLDLAGANGVGVWCPASAGSVMPVAAEIDGRVSKSAALESADGTAHPVQVIGAVRGGSTFASVDVPAMVAPLVLSFLFQEEEMFGGRLIDARVKTSGDTAKLTLAVGGSPVGVDVDKMRRDALDRITDSGASKLGIEIEMAPRVRVATVLDDLKPFSLNTYRMTRLKAQPETDVKAGENSIENALLKVSANDDGTVDIFDKRTGVEYPKCLRFEDMGDRGDEYTFEPVHGDEPVTAPVKLRAKVVRTGPVAATLRIDSGYKVPASLDRKGLERSKKLVSLKISTDLTLYSGIGYVDCRSTFDNTARDHRLRVLFEAPFATDEFICESTFEVTHRRVGVEQRPRKPDPDDVLSILIGPEAEVGFGPHKGFAAVEREGAGMALFNRGLPEIEAVRGANGTALALTLVRSVGTISRDDMTLRVGHAGPAIDTPEGQCQGEHICEYALYPYSGSWAEISLPAQCRSWRHGPRLFPLPKGRGKPKVGLSPVAVDNPAVEIRALQPAPDGSKALCARIYNTTDGLQKAKLRIAERFQSFDECDLMGRPLPDSHITGRFNRRSAQIELPPARIMSLLLWY